jgi:branched-chain amino acid transport system permease protein
VIGITFYLALTRTRTGTAIRAVSVNPVAAQLVAIDVQAASAFAFAVGGALVAAGGVLVSMFLTFNASMGVVFTMKALIVVIMGGLGNIFGALVAGLLLGVAETAVARLVDPGLTLAVTYALFLTVLLVRPTGLFGRSAR